MAGKKYWKISLVDMVITCENIGFITRGLWPLVINPIFSLVITITTRDIFQYFFPAIYYYLIITTSGIIMVIIPLMIKNFGISFPKN